MSLSIQIRAALIGAVMLPAVTATCIAAPPRQQVASQGTVSGAALSPSERGQMARQFVLKWGNYMQRVYGVPVGTWAQRMVPSFARVDSSNFRKALGRDTFEGAMAELNGSGARLSDTQVIDRLAKLPRNTGKNSAAVAKLGDLSQDLVYTPIQPCRIVDTRSTAGGMIAAGATRSFVALTNGNYTAQGGSATDCGTAGLSATAVALNVTAVTPTANGYTTVFPFGTTQPLSSNVNYYSSITAANGVIATIPNPLSTSDFTIFSSASAHYVIDILGYFAPPVATPLDCLSTGTPQSFTISANSTNFFNNPACPTGYKAMTPYCWTASAGVYSQGSGYNANVAGNATFCSWQNTTASNQTVFGGNICCRVPGR